MIVTVWVNGVVQHESTDYIVLDEYAVKFNYAPNTGDRVVVDTFISAVDKHNSTFSGDGQRTIFGIERPPFTLIEYQIDVDHEHWAMVSMRKDVSIWFREACGASEDQDWYDHRVRSKTYANVICMKEKLFGLVTLKWS